MTRRSCLLLAFLAAFAIGGGSRSVAEAQSPGSGLPVPRFVSLRSGEVNLRAGPGSRYPIEWIFTRQGMPVEVVAEFDTWRRIRDWEGTEGWVHQSLLTGRRSMIVTGGIRDLLARPADDSAVVARAEPGVMGVIEACPAEEPAWCRIDLSGYDGWMRRDWFWGVYREETVE